MSQWKVILAALIIFGSGVITGGLLVKTTVPVKTSSGQHKPNVGGPAPWQLQRVEFYRRIEKELNLTPEQKQSIDKVFKDSQERTKPLWEKISPELKSEIQRVQTEIKAELTPEQTAKFDELLKTKTKKGEKTEEKRHKKKEGNTNTLPASPSSSTNQ